MRIFGRSFPLQSRDTGIARSAFPPEKIISPVGIGLLSKLSPSVLTTGSNLVNQSSYSTSNITPSANVLVVAAFILRLNSGDPSTGFTISGGGITWAQVIVPFASIASPQRALCVAWGSSSNNPTTEAVTLSGSPTWDHAAWMVLELRGANGVRTSSVPTNRADTGNTLSVSHTNGGELFGTLAIWGAGVVNDLTPESGHNKIQVVSVTEASIISTLMAQEIDANDNSVSATASSSVTWAGVVLEPTYILPHVKQKLYFPSMSSSEVFGTPTVTIVPRILPSSISSAEVFGTPKVNHQLYPTSINSAEVIGTSKLNQRLNLTGITTAETLGSAQINRRLNFIGISSGSSPSVPAVLGTGNTTTSSSSFIFTPTTTPSANRLQILLVRNSAPAVGAPTTPTVTGLGLTWVQVGTVSWGTIASPAIRMTLFRAMGASPTSGNLTVNLGGVNHGSCSYTLLEVLGAVQGGTNGEDAVVQVATHRLDSGTSISNTLSAFSSHTNGTIAFFSSGVGPSSITVEEGWTEITEITVGSASRMAATWIAIPDTTPSATFNSSGPLASIAIELKYANEAYGFGTPVVTATEADVIFPSSIISQEIFGSVTVVGGPISTARGHIVDGNTFALWRADDIPPGMIDASGNGRHLSQFAGTEIATDAIIFDRGKSRYFDGSTRYRILGDTNWDTLWLGEWTIELWLILGETNSTTVPLMAYYATGETQADNYLMKVSLVYSSGNYNGEIFWENGAGSDVSYTTNFNVITSSNSKKRHHLAFRKRLAGTGTYFVDFFSNGVLIDTSPALGNADGGTNGDMYLGGDSTLFFGRMDDIRISSVSRSLLEIYTSARNGLGSAPPTIVIVV